MIEQQKPSLSNATIGVVTALPLELAAVCKVFGWFHPVTHEGRTYRLSTIQRRENDGAHIVAACCLHDMGNNSAAAATTAMFADCRNIRYVVMCGIGGAIPSPKKASDHCRLGDIVVPVQHGVVQYDYESDREWDVETRPRFYNPSPVLLDAAHQLAVDEQLGSRPWLRHLENALADGRGNGDDAQLHWQRPPPESDVIREFSGDRPLDHVVRKLRSWGVRKLTYRIIPHPPDKDRPAAGPKVFRGVIASANRLERNSINRDALAKRFSAMIVDMESGGVADAAYQRGVGFFVVRGASDYCNEQKNKDWQPHAACAAAAYLRALIEVTPPAPLSLPGDGPSTAPTELGAVTNTLTSHTLDRAPTAPRAEASFSTQPELNDAIQEMLIGEGRRLVTEITRCLDAWEYPRAIELADAQSRWVESYADKLPRSLLYEVYVLLARTEIAKADRERREGKDPDLTRAESYLAKAKNVAE